jgi:hypothetical protein
MLRTSPFTKPSSIFARWKRIYEEGDLKAQNGSPLRFNLPQKPIKSTLAQI